MTKIPIRLKLVTEIYDEKHHKELITMKSEGMLYNKDGAIYLSFKEKLENIGEVCNIVKIKHDEMTIIRSGSITMRQTYKKGATTSGSYRSPYGLFETTASTETIDFTYSDHSKKSKLTLVYVLQIDGEWIGRHHLTYLIEKI